MASALLAILLLAAGGEARAPDADPAGAPGADAADASAVAGDDPSYEATVRSAATASKDRAADADVVSGERLRESARPSTFEAIAQESADLFVPARGVGPHGIGDGATGAIHVRGLGGSPNAQVLVVEDGVPDYQGVFGHPVADAYAPALLDEVLVVKGGDSVLYGTNALGGAIVLRSRWREREGLELWSDSSAGSYATLRQSVAALGRAGRWDGAAAFTGLDTQGHREGAGGAEAIGQAAARCRLGAGVTLTAREKLAHVTGNDPGPVSHPTLDHGFDAWRSTASLELAWEAPGARAALTPYLNVGTHRLYDGFYSRDEVGGAIAEGEARLGSDLRLLGGLALEGVGGRVLDRIAGAAPPVKGSWSGSAYAQGTWRPLPGVTAVLGARELASTAWGSVPLYKAALRVEPWPGLVLRARVAANFRQPTLRELYLPYPVASPDLRPERARNASLGVAWDAGRLAVEATGYRTEATDLIKYFGVFPAAEVVNADRLTIWGAEGRVAVRGLGPLQAYASADVQDVGRFTRQNPSARATFGADAAAAVGASGRLVASVDGEWVHGLYMADYARERLPDVVVVDLAVRYRHVDAARGLTLEPYVAVRNLLDRRYAYVAGYVMPGLNATVGIRIGA